MFNPHHPPPRPRPPPPRPAHRPRRRAVRLRARLRRARARAMIRRGEIRPLILATLAARPMHGYEVIQELEAQSGGRWRPSAGSVYPTLQQLTDEGLLTSEEVDGRRVYSLTDEGKAAAEPRRPRSAGPRRAATGTATSATSRARSPRRRCRCSASAPPTP